MIETLEQLFKFDRQLLGSGYDNALEYLNTLIGLTTIAVPSGTELGTWTVPDEWVPKQAWLKYEGKKILDYQKEPLSLMVYSLPFQGKVSKEELLKHIYTAEEIDDAIPYAFRFYEKDWGLCMSKKQKEALKEGEYEVFIDTEFKPGVMKLGVHTLPGKTDREIVLLAHLDHPQQANDNLSGVACLLDVIKKLKCEHTVKLVFCPETIGSQAYIYTQDVSKVDFVVAVDICGNDNSILFQKSWKDEDRINRVTHCALQMVGQAYRKGKFRTSIGSDETPFNDPLVGVPGIMLSRWPYPEYHTNQDTPDKLDYGKISETADLIVKIIEIYEKDYIPERKYKGPLMRSRYGIQSPFTRVNLVWDYLNYSIDGKQWLSEICASHEFPFDEVYKTLEKIADDGKLEKKWK